MAKERYHGDERQHTCIISIGHLYQFYSDGIILTSANFLVVVNNDVTIVNYLIKQILCRFFISPLLVSAVIVFLTNNGGILEYMKKANGIIS
jgi:hypothetical protein